MNTGYQLCNNCSRNCDNSMRTALAITGKLTYVYLNNGAKFINTCNLYNIRSTVKTANNTLNILLKKEAVLVKSS